MNDKDRMIEKQLEVISALTRNNLRRMSDDFFGNTPKIKEEGISGENNDTDAKAKPKSEIQPEAEKEEAPEKIEDLLDELHSYIGLENIKKEVESLINMVKVHKHTLSAQIKPSVIQKLRTSFRKGCTQGNCINRSSFSKIITNGSLAKLCIHNAVKT